MRKVLGRLCALAVLAASAVSGSAYADGKPKPTPDVAAPPVRAAPVAAPAATAAAPVGRAGVIALADGLISLTVPAGYRYYSPAEARAFLERNRAAAPAGQILGLVAPAAERIDQPGAWGSVVSYDTLGYVAADTASGLTAANFEADVRAVRASQNRPFEGFAIQPAFDPTGASLSWAERAAPPGAGGSDLRHEQRILGRSAVAALTTIGAAAQQAQIATAAPDLYAMVSFAEGQRYGDFVAASDQPSTFTLPALVTGVAPAETAIVAEAASAGGAGAGSRAGGVGGIFPWIAGGVIALAGLGYLATRGRAKKEAEANLAPEEDA